MLAEHASDSFQLIETQASHSQIGLQQGTEGKRLPAYQVSLPLKGECKSLSNTRMVTKKSFPN